MQSLVCLKNRIVGFEAFYPAHDKWYAGRACPIVSGLAVYFQKAYQRGRFDFTALGLLGGAGIYTLINSMLATRGA